MSFSNTITVYVFHSSLSLIILKVPEDPLLKRQTSINTKAVKVSTIITSFTLSCYYRVNFDSHYFLLKRD